MSERKPIFNSQVANEFGEELLNEELRSRSLDLTYVKGFSDMRFERDEQIAEVVRGERQGHDVRSLPVNLRWVRHMSPKDNRPDGLKVLGSGVKGYKPVTKDMLGQEWLKELPPGATVMPDGTIAKHDVTLMYCDNKTAARNANAKQRATNAMLNEPDPSPEGVFGVAGKHKGAAPSVKKLKGERITKAEVFQD